MKAFSRRAVFLATILALALVASDPLPAAAQGRGLGFERARARMMLDNVARDIEKNFYDAELRDLPWKELVAQARQKIDSSQSIGEMLTAIFAITDAIKDSHTVFIPPGRAVRSLFGFEAKAFGEEIRIYELKEKGVAAAAGLQRGDRIWAINGFDAKRKTFDLMMLFFRRLRPVGRMEIVYSRDNQPPKTILLEGKVKRDAMITDLTDLDTIYQLIREAQSDEEEFLYRKPKDNDGIGYLYLPYFSGNTGYLRRFVKKVKDARAVIVDLRGNPGGAIKGLTYLCSFFDPKGGSIGDMVGRKKTEPLKVKPRKPKLHGPLFILVDSQSASASEIFARHFQRTGRATVIGDRTSGRVSAARIHDHKIGLDVVAFYGTQVAFARLIFPDGEELEGAGVTPDVECIPTSKQLRDDKDVCEELAYTMARLALGLADNEEEKEETTEEN